MPYRSIKLLLLLTLTLKLTLLHSEDFFAVKDKIIQESRFKIGFLYFTPLFLLENIGYTSSIYTYEDREIPDWTGDLGLGLRASAIVANRLILRAEDLPQYSFYLENKNLRAWSNRFSASAYSHFGPLDFKVGFSRNDLNQRPQLEFSRPYRYISNQWSAEAEFGRRSGIYLTAYASFNEQAYGDDSYAGNYNLAKSLDRRENVFGLKLNKRIFTDTIIFAGYEQSDYLFALSSERDADARQIALGVEFPKIGALQGSFKVGVKRFDPANPLFRTVQRLNGRGDVRLTLAERFHLSAQYELDTLFSYGGSDLFYDSKAFGGGVEVYLTRFLKAGTTYRDGWMKYHSFVDPQPSRRDRIRQQQYYLAIPFIGKTSLGAAYNVYRLTSDALGLDYTRKFWGAFLSYEF